MKTENSPNTPGAAGLDGWFDAQALKFEKARFFWMTIYLTVQSCWGSIAAGYILLNHADIWVLASCAAITMGSNAVFIAQGSGKACLITFYASLLVNTVFIILNV